MSFVVDCGHRRWRCGYTGVPTFDVVPPMTTVTGYGSRIAVDSAHAEYTWWARHDCRR